MIGGIYSLLGLIVVLVYKSTHVVSLAHGQLLAYGALFFWFLLGASGYPLWISLLFALFLGAAMGFLVERFTMRPLIGQSLFSAFLMTFAVFMFLNGLFMLLLEGRSLALPHFLPKGILDIGGVTAATDQILSFLISTLFFVILILFFKYTKVGLGMRATAEDHRLAQSSGVNVRNIFTTVWVLSAVGAVITGIVTANVTDINYPMPYIGIKGIIVAIFGGMDSIGGAFLAGLILAVFENISAGYLDPIVGGGMMEVAAYILLLFILLVRPYGLFGLKRIERI